ncbi:MAG: SufE family protein [Spirochaetaceae bacterium]|nr:MAG: SufE family protein [Spirochaetaceae bacterium]
MDGTVEKKSLEEMRAYLEEITSELLMMREMDNLEMYRMLTDMGKELEGLSEEEKTEENYVYGCISNVHIADELREGRMVYRGVSDAHVVRGYLAVLVNALSGLAPEDVLSGTREAVEKFARETDLKASLTPNRANAFGNIYKLMVDKAARRM